MALARTHPQASLPQAGDLTREISKRAKASAIEFTGYAAASSLKPSIDPGSAKHALTTHAATRSREDYSFGDVSRELNKRRSEWVTGYLGKEYEFGDLTKKFVSDFTGKDDYKAPNACDSFHQLRIFSPEWEPARPAA